MKTKSQKYALRENIGVKNKEDPSSQWKFLPQPLLSYIFCFLVHHEVFERAYLVCFDWTDIVVPWSAVIASTPKQLDLLSRATLKRCVLKSTLFCIEDLIKFVDLFQNITSITLKDFNCGYGGARALRSLLSLSQLIYLDLSLHGSMTNRKFESLSNLNALQHLVLRDTMENVTQAGFKHLASMQQLRVLEFYWCEKLNLSSLIHMASLRVLVLCELELYPDELDIIFDSLSILPLTKLTLNHTNFTYQNLRCLTKATTLTTLVLHNKDIDDEGLSDLKTMSALTCLILDV